MTTDIPGLGTWLPGAEPPAFEESGLHAAVSRMREPAHVVREGTRGRLGVAFGGLVEPPAIDPGDGPGDGRQIGGGARASAVTSGPRGSGYLVLGTLPPLYPEWLGERAFTEEHRLRFPYVAGEMANGIATPRLVVAMARAGMLGFYGAAGLTLARLDSALDEIERALGTDSAAAAWGSNLIHSPAEPDLEEAVADLYLRRGVKRICASAFMGLTPAVVRCAATGLTRDGRGRIVRRHRLIAKISRPEVAELFMGPAPPALLEDLVRAGKLQAAEAALAAQVPVAEDITVEADSGGHTDNRPLGALFPVIQALRDATARRHGWPSPIRVGAAGGLGTPAAVAAAFSLGAAYVVTGTVNQAAVEAGLSADGKSLLAQAGIADVIMAPAADMFEMGVKVQVLRRGTMFGPRALRLYELYRNHESLEAMPAAVRERLEREILGASCTHVWAEVRHYFQTRDPRDLARAEREPRHRMALIFRWYLGLSSRWAMAGETGRRLDYQIWCGPAMGAFNAWVKNSFLEAPEQRTVVQIALNLLEGAATLTRAQQLRSAGVAIPAAAFAYTPRPLG
jgi:trans-AT polyketide synthase/acyltransferase/oxidoreductase domain-containing protein